MLFHGFILILGFQYSLAQHFCNLDCTRTTLSRGPVGLPGERGPPGDITKCNCDYDAEEIPSRVEHLEMTEMQSRGFY